MHNNYLSISTATIPWTHRLANILRVPSLSNTPRSVQHLTGEIWKHIFSICVYSDLEHVDTMLISSRIRRFARLEQSGLSGVILYEIPVKRRPDGRTHPGFTLEEVFGSKEGKYEDGMNMGELLGSTDARLVYFPAYACTSFFIGQVMHTFFTGDCHLLLRPALDGFFVFTGSSDQGGFESAESIVDESVVAAQLCDVEDSEDSAASNSDEDERLSEKFDSSVDSLGPPTPPRLDSPPIHDFNTVLLDILAPEK